MEEFKKILFQHVDEFDDFISQTGTLVVIVIDKDLKISTHNNSFSQLITSGIDASGKLINAFLLPESRGILPLPDSVKSQSVRLNFTTSGSSSIPLNCHVVRVEDGKHLILGGQLMLASEEILQKMTIMSNEMANITRDIQRKNRELKAAHSKIKILSGLIPICMYCKKIRDDQGYWNKLEKFISENSEAEFSHGICDPCMEKHFPEPDD